MSDGLDILIQGARVHDGERFLPHPTRVGIRGDTLVLPQPGAAVEAKTVIEAAELTLAPAFIDVHNHGDLRVLTRDGVNLLAQGVGTIVVGHCGFSPWGRCGRHPVFLEDSPATDFRSAREFFAALGDAPLPLNVASMAGLAALLPTRGLKTRLEAALDAGAIGLSVGLNYAGQDRVDTETLHALARVLAARKDRWAGICWHMRDQGERLLDSVREVVRVHQAGGVPCHICHLKRAGLDHPEELDQALALLEPHPGITCDMYPYVEGWTVLDFVVSAGRQTAQPRASLAELAMTGCRKCCPNLWADIVLVSGVDEGFLGKTVQEVADMLGKDGLAAYLDLRARCPAATACYMNQAHASNVEAVLRQPDSLVGSDGHVYGPGERGHHPRAFGAFARFLAGCRDRNWMSLEHAIRKLTAQPAERFRLLRRGRIRPDYFADLCLFDPTGIRDTATFAKPNLPAQGVKLVVLNGRQVFRDGLSVGRNGRRLGPA